MMIQDLRVSFEVEGYILRDGKVYITTAEEQMLFETNSDTRRFHPVLPFPHPNYMIEGKTSPLTSSSRESATRAIQNLKEGLQTLIEISGKDDLTLRCDTALYDSLPVPEPQRENAGTHVHVEYQPLADYLTKKINGNFSVAQLIWRMRQNIPEFVKKYCPNTDRLKRKIADHGESDFAYLGLVQDHNVYRQTINFRGPTIEMVIADSTDSLQVLNDLGEDFKRSALEAVDFLEHNPTYQPPKDDEERVRIMRSLFTDNL